MAVTTIKSPALTAYPGWSSTRERGRPARTLFLQTACHPRPLPCKAHQTRLYGVLFHRAGRPRSRVVFVRAGRPRSRVVFVRAGRPRSRVVFVRARRPRSRVVFLHEP